MNQNATNNTAPAQTDNQTIQPVEHFKGDTLEELRYNRAMMALKAEFCKEKMLADLQAAKSQTILGKLQRGEGTGLFKSGVLGKMARSLNYVDYILVGLTAFKTIRSITSLFRRNK